MMMNIARLTAATLSLCLAAGCSSPLMNRHGDPTPLHTDRKVTELLPEDQNTVENIPLRTYLHTLACASGDLKNASCEGIDKDRYMRDGIALVDSYCDRWFVRLNKLQRNFQYQEGNVNIIKDLGTTLIGLSRLHSDVTAVYGAAGIAADGWFRNINDVLFLAPNPAIVQKRVREAMHTRARQLTGDSKPASFVQAYVELERYADMCTFYAARMIADESMQQSKASTDADGNITVAPTKAAIAAAAAAAAER